MERCGITVTKSGRAAWLLAVALAAGGGCWEEIEYKGLSPDAAAPRALAPSNDEPLSDQEQLAFEQPATAPAPPATTQSDAAPLRDDYAADSADHGVSSSAEEFAEPSPEPAASVAAEPPAAREPQPQTDRYAMPAVEASANYAATESHVEDGFADADSTMPASSLDPAEQPLDSAAEPISSALAAWRLGDKLSLAALAHDRGVAADSVDRWLAESRLLAESLGTAIGELPEPTAGESDQVVSPAVLDYLLSQGQRVGRDLARQHGPRHPALFEVAMKANLLRVLHEPGSITTKKLSTSIAVAAERAELPAELLQPLVDMQSAAVGVDAVRSAVKRLHADVERHLEAKQADAVATTAEGER